MITAVINTFMIAKLTKQAQNTPNNKILSMLGPVNAFDFYKLQKCRKLMYCNMAVRGLTDIASYMHDCQLKRDFISLYTRPNSA